MFEDKVIRALSWKEPYGTLMLHGKIETRKWNTNYRGLVLMCASKTPYNFKSQYAISGGTQYSRILRTLYGKITHDGYAFAIGNLVDCRHMKVADEDKCFVEYYPDLFCHVYEDVQAIEPFPWKGMQGWKTLTQQQKSLIKLI